MEIFRNIMDGLGSLAVAGTLWIYFFEIRRLKNENSSLRKMVSQIESKYNTDLPAVKRRLERLEERK